MVIAIEHELVTYLLLTSLMKSWPPPCWQYSSGAAPKSDVRASRKSLVLTGVLLGRMFLAASAAYNCNFDRHISYSIYGDGY
jgi:hypothetical protein